MSYIAPALREKIRRQAGNRCGYCLGRQELVLGVLEIDHNVIALMVRRNWVTAGWHPPPE